MKTIVTIENSNHSQSNKTLTILSALLIGLLAAGGIGYVLYKYWNKPVTVFSPVKNKKIVNLLKDSKEIATDNLQDDKKRKSVERIFGRLKEECIDKKLVDKQKEVTEKGEKSKKLPPNIEEALKNGQKAENEIKDFIELQNKSKNKPTEEGGEFNKRVHNIIKTPTNKQSTPPTAKQIESAFGKLVGSLKEAQATWDQGKEGDTSYEKLYVHHSLVSEYKRVKGILDNSKPDS